MCYSFNNTLNLLKLSILYTSSALPYIPSFRTIMYSRSFQKLKVQTYSRSFQIKIHITTNIRKHIMLLWHISPLKNKFPQKYSYNHIYEHTYNDIVTPISYEKVPTHWQHYSLLKFEPTTSLLRDWRLVLVINMIYTVSILCMKPC